MIITGNLHVDSLDNLKYNISSQKWSFEMNLNSYYNWDYPINSKIKIDIRYKGNDTTAICTHKSSTQYLCIPDEENQNQDDIFEVSKTKKYGTITFSNSDDKLIILTYANLKLKIANHLSFFDSGKCGFILEVSESNLPNRRQIMIDIKEDYYISKAICTIYGEVLECDSIKILSKNKPIYLTYNKNKNNKYVKWSNLIKDEPIYVNLYINLLNVFGCFMKDSYKFNIQFNSEGDSKNYFISEPN